MSDREAIARFVDMVRALLRHTNPCNVNEGHSQQWFAVNDECDRILASRPPAEPVNKPIYSQTGQLKGYVTVTAPPATAPDNAEHIAWAVSRWKAECENRPLRNIHRRAIDGHWRQVILHFGGEPDVLLGPDHQERVNTEGLPAATAPASTAMVEVKKALEDAGAALSDIIDYDGGAAAATEDAYVMERAGLARTAAYDALDALATLRDDKEPGQ